MISFSDLATDPRVNRQIRFLSDDHDVVAAGWNDPGISGVEFVCLRPQPKPWPRQLASAARLLARSYESYYWNRSDVTDCLARLSGQRADLFLANDLDALPVTLAVANGGKVLFDAHEYAPLEFEDRWFFRVFQQDYRTWLCREYLQRAAAVTTVCESIAKAYQRDSGTRPTVILNASEYEDLVPVEPSGGRGPWQLVHHGAAIRSRKIENMIRMMRHLDERFELSLVLVGNDRRYLDRLRREADGDRRIRFLPPVAMRELPRFLNAFDIGLFLLEPTNFNYRYALPNKLFEFVQARLAVAIGPSPEMARLVREHDLGLIAEDFDPRSLARLLSGLDRDRLLHFKQRSHLAARQLSADTSRRQLLALVDRLLGEPV